MKAIDRLFQYIDVKGLKPTRFEKEVGLSNGYLRTQEKRNADLGESVLLKILDYCLDIEPMWLLSGKGKMLRSEFTPESMSYTQQEPPQMPSVSDVATAYKAPKGIPLIPVEAMAGALSGNSDTIMEYECEHYVIPMFKGAELLIPVRGDSMQPRFCSGDVVACKRLPLGTFFQWNKPYVIDSEQGVIIKRVKPGQDNEHLTMVSDNPEYPPFTLERAQIYSLALVIGVVRTE